MTNKHRPGFDLIQDKCWAILPSKLEEIDAFVRMKLAGEQIDVEAVMAAAGKNGNKADDTYCVIDGVAVLPVSGTLAKRMNLFMDMSGGTSYQLLARDFKAALADPAVNSILLDIDSPGGTVDGNKEVSDLIYASRGVKTIVAYGNGTMASAAMRIGAAADYVLAGPESQNGSVGVTMTHYDFSERDRAMGVKRTTINAGKYKRIASDEKPLSREGENYLQDQVDTYYSSFVDDIARYRGVASEKVLSDMADGKIFIGAAAQAAGLIDAVGTIETAFYWANTKPPRIVEEYNMELKDLTKQELVEKRPDLVADIKADGHKEGKAEAEKGIDTAVSAAVTRTVGLAKAGLGDAPATTLQALVDAGSDPVKIAEAMKSAPTAKGKTSLQTLADQQASQKPLDGKDTGAGADGKKLEEEKKGFMQLVDEHMKATAGCSKTEAIFACRAAHPEAHEAWLQEVNKH